ncbi:uncharacterized protein [Symphalangus syndactylus]|uniref:uncharacterized protein isoform X1 n=1 Tax=Symphalangus syndactylus TaxID=9590 RepID=UPI003006E103
MWESLELPRDLLNGFDQNADSDMDNEVQAEMVSDGDKKFIGNWSKDDSCYALVERPGTFCLCLRDLWNFELERDDLGYLVEEISKWQVFQEEAEQKSLGNLQSNDVTEKKSPFSGEKFKLAAKIFISNKELNVNHQDNRENVFRACQRPSWQPLPSQAWRPRRKKWFPWLGPGSPCSVQPQDMVPCVSAASAPAMVRRGQGTAWAIASEGASPKPWCFPQSVEPVGTQKSTIEVWEPPPRFQRMYRNAWMSRQKFAAGVEPSWRTSARAVWMGNVGSEPPHRVPTKVLPSGAVRRGPLSSRLQNGRSTDSLHSAPGKATDTQCQPVKAARRGTVSCKATGVKLPKAVGAHFLHQHDLYVRHRIKGNHFGTLRHNDCPIGFCTCMGTVAPLFWPISPIWNGCIY